jgi:DNA invertase Pin-like site-specific DNA recombinase
MKIAVLYRRVSTQRQADEGVSLQAQAEKARAWCEAMGYTVVGEFEDAGISAKRADNRPALQDALDLTTRDGAALVVFSLSRLARSTKDALNIAERLDKAGADLISLSEDLNTATAAGRMIYGLLAILSQFERELIGERVKAALACKRDKGFRAGGSTPFGFDEGKGGRLLENTTEQETISLICSLRAEGMTLRAIASELDLRGITSKRGKRAVSQ